MKVSGVQGAKRRGRPKALHGGSGLIGQRILVKWINDQDKSEVLYIGRVESFRKVRTAPCLFWECPVHTSDHLHPTATCSS